MEVKNTLIVIVGPTASGKSELAVQIAKKINGEIISADSRQIYKGMDIGSGKVEGQWKNNIYYYKNIPHYLIDEVSPRRQYSVAQFQKKSKKIISDILKRGKTPIICGGTAHWVDAIVFEQSFPTVSPNKNLRSKLSKLSVEEMYTKLEKLDPNRAATIDAKNPRRLLRALEIVLSTGKPVPASSKKSNYLVHWIGLNPDTEELETKIKKRLMQRLKKGMVKEVESLHKSGISWKRLESFGLEYKYCAMYLQGKLSEKEMKDQLFTAIKQFTKRQRTWWKNNQSIKWYQSAAVVKTPNI
jgi:tRNA dimethylallyltransferase